MNKYFLTSGHHEDFYVYNEIGNSRIASASENSFCSFDEEYFFTMYDVKMTDLEANYYKAHYLTWKHFIEYGAGDVCMICEDKVRLKADHEFIEDLANQLPEDADLFLPYNRLNLDEENKTPEICTSTLGYFVGCPLYFLTRKGAEKLLKYDIIRMPLDETILALSISGDLTVDYTELAICEYDYLKSTSYLSRQNALKKALFTNSRWREQDSAIVRKIIGYLAGYCSRLQIDLVLHAGSLIGAIRHGGIMPWDDDVDFAVHSLMIPKLAALIREEGILGISPMIFPKTSSVYFKCWLLDEGDETPGINYRFPFVDIWVFYDQIEEGYIVHKEGHRYPKNICMPFRDAYFEGSHVKMPYDPLGTLDLQYPGWRDRIIVYPWNHRFKKESSSVLSLPIQVNQDGTYLADL
ncbi:LicD family protein [Mucilaginibacter aquaedulcis]|uniref:LicD family protein n=1 Tax=Mucilaginibacter aquaedulcis TaxID=1187081 RepID=UPI0025B3B490|nr:LicD family protein [Mucilaginibacter aquaedulcis]MDN3548898.1 LicD family protein [Mucilaginibacter aquaedulcis]